MSVFGLHHSLFYVDKNISVEELDIARAELQDIIEHTKKHKAKLLYNEMLDYISVNNYINLLSKYEKDPAYISMVINRPFEVFECTHENKVTSTLLIDTIVDNYIVATYVKLVDTYFHNLVFSKNHGGLQLDGKEYKMFVDFDEINFSVVLLPDIPTVNDFDRYFSLYEWFYSRRGKRKIFLTDSFRLIINRVNNLDDILTSLLRGVYYPEYDTHQGIERSIYDIDAHRDNNQKVRIKSVMERKSDETILYRVNVVPHNIAKQGILRIGYSIYRDTYIIFCYHDNHCDKMVGFKDKKFVLDDIKYNLSII